MAPSPYFDYPGEEPVGDENDDLGFLAGCSDDDWAVIRAYTRSERLLPGDVAVAPGDADRSLYIVLDGSLEAVMPRGLFGRDHRLGDIRPGSVFGEVAFLDGRPRSALVRATEEVHLLRLRLDDFEALAADRPDLAHAILFDLGRVLAARVRRMQTLLGTGLT